MIEVKFTKEDEAKFNELLKLAQAAALTDEQMPEFMALMKAKKDSAAEREAQYVNVATAIMDLGIPFSYLYDKGCFGSEAVLELVKAKGLIVVPEKASKAKSEESENKPPKTKLFVGTFDLTEYGFPGVSYTWDFNNSPRGRSQDVAYVKAIKEGGVEKASKFFTQELKDWIEQTEVYTKGRYAGKTVFNNKAEFYKAFGVNIDVLTGQPEVAAVGEKVAMPTKTKTEAKAEVKAEVKKPREPKEYS